jgi:sulfoxide reductase heme-binding subunit YedZ
MFPWTDRNGKLSLLKLPFFLLTLAPGLWIALQWKMDWLGSRPVTEAIHQNGDWVVRFLMLSLAITPLRFAGRWPKLINVRRMLGVAALAYVLIHFSLYIVDQKFNLATVASEIALRIYLTIGFTALLGLTALGATSTDGMIRRLGAARWNSLHALVYPIAVLALTHFYIQSKLNVTEPVLMTGVFALLMMNRALRWLRWPTGAVALLATVVVAAALTAGAETLWYWAIRGIDPWRVLSSQLDFDYQIRPAWWVLCIGLSLPLIALIRGHQAPRRRPAPKRAPAAQLSDA